MVTSVLLGLASACSCADGMVSGFTDGSRPTPGAGGGGSHGDDGDNGDGDGDGQDGEDGENGDNGDNGESGNEGDSSTSPPYRSPYAVAYSNDAALLAVSDATAGELVVLDAKAGTSLRSVKLTGRPKGLAWSGAGRVLVAEYGAGTLAEVDAAAGSVVRRLAVGPKPTDVAVSSDGATVVVPEFGLGQVLILDGATGATRATVAVAPYPFAVALAPSGKTAVVTHLMASGDATQPDAGASVSLVDVSGAKVSASIRLPLGSSGVRGVRCSPDGKWAYVVHTLGRVSAPATQLLRGWVNTDALSVIDLTGQSLYATVLLDRLNEGSANPWGVDVSKDGKSLWVSASGAHTVLRVDLSLLHPLMAGQIPSALVRTPGKVPTLTDRSKAAYTKPLSDVWFEIAADSKKRALLADDLGALYSVGAMQVISLAPAHGPRGVAVSPDGKQLAVALYFAGQVGLVNVAGGTVDRYVSVGTQPEETWARQGERLFNDASSTLQGWLACATCHVDGRSDGLTWDLVNDGMGNTKNTKSVVYTTNTPPAMAHGILATPGVAITAEFEYVKSYKPTAAQELALGAYLNTLAGERAPSRPAGQHSASAQRGQAVFAKVKCGECHAGRYYTDLKLHDVGTKNSRDTRADFDTPTLSELWRSAPYLHDGSAATVKDVLTTRNASGKHAATSTLSADELTDLVQYVLELDAPTPEKVAVYPGGDAAPPKEKFQGEAPTVRSSGGLDLTDPKLAMLDKILFIKRDFIPTSDHGSGGHICDQYHGFNAQRGGGLFVLENVLSGSPRERNVLANATCANGPHQGKKLEGGGFLSPDLHADGKQIVFAYTDIGQRVTWNESSVFHIFKVNADGTGLTQLTQGPNNDFDPTWLPDGRIVFISDRRGGWGRCHPRPVPVYTLYVMNADGSGVEPISLHETNEWHPSVDRNGMLLYSRWDYVDRGANQVHHSWTTTPDGLDARAVSSNYATRMNVTPRALLNLRNIPGTNKYVGTAVAHHQQAYGSLVVVDPDIEDDDGMAQYTVLTNDAKFPEATTDTGNDMKYATAWPIDEDRFLVVHDPQSNEAGLNNKRFAIYLIDRQGNKKLLYKDSAHSCLDPIPLAARQAPPVMLPSRAGKKTDPAEVTLLNVYDSMLPFPNGVEIKALRVVQVFPKSTPNTIAPRLGHGAMLFNDQNGRGSLGTVPVEKDGSARFLLPPGVPVFFQALDANGLAVQSMRSATYAVPGSTVIVCQGCHERRYRAPSRAAALPLALSRAPSVLQPEADGSMPLSFPRLIQPILDKRCASCHENNSKTFSLSTGNYQSNGDRFYASYSNLRPFASFYNFNDAFGPTVTTPGKFGALSSRLYPLLKSGHQGVTLSADELRAFGLWLDLNSDMYSDQAKRDAQARGEAVTPSIE
jgi:DNA-binding beta-propeller fold protein YncE/mono/diheme cytochrome c family protein